MYWKLPFPAQALFDNFGPFPAVQGGFAFRVSRNTNGIISCVY